MDLRTRLRERIWRLTHVAQRASNPRAFSGRPLCGRSDFVAFPSCRSRRPSLLSRLELWDSLDEKHLRFVRSPAEGLTTEWRCLLKWRLEAERQEVVDLLDELDGRVSLARGFVEGSPEPVAIEDEVAACAELLRDLSQGIRGRHESAFELVPEEHKRLVGWLADVEAGVQRLDLVRKDLAARTSPQQRAEADELTRVWMEAFALEPHAHFVCPVCRVRPRQTTFHQQLSAGNRDTLLT